MNDRRSEYVEASKSFRGTQMPYGEQAELAVPGHDFGVIAGLVSGEDLPA